MPNRRKLTYIKRRNPAAVRDSLGQDLVIIRSILRDADHKALSVTQIREKIIGLFSDLVVPKEHWVEKCVLRLVKLREASPVPADEQEVQAFVLTRRGQLVSGFETQIALDRIKIFRDLVADYQRKHAEQPSVSV